MKKLGSEKGLDLQWMAVEHNNTDHHHIHVVILGKDKNGTDVRIDKKDYDKIKDYGDRYLERVHPLELERARTERERKEKEPTRSKEAREGSGATGANQGRHRAAMDAQKNTERAARAI
jgi:type IV secretory pathway VirD2 relaxase